MKTRLNQAGASHLVAILAVVVIAAVGVIGYRVMSQDDAGTQTATQSANTNSGAIENKDDVEAASKELDSTSLDNVDPSQLDSDINSVL